MTDDQGFHKDRVKSVKWLKLAAQEWCLEALEMMWKIDQGKIQRNDLIGSRFIDRLIPLKTF